MKYIILTIAFLASLWLPIRAEISVSLANNITCVCPGNPQQAFTVTADGTAGPFTFEWEGPNFSSTQMMPTNIENGGMYTLKVTNTYQCTFEYHIEVPGCEGPSFDFQSTPPTFCNPESGSISVSLDDQSTNFQINWFKDDVLLETEQGVGSFLLEDVGAGSYHVEAVDINGAGCIFTSDPIILEETDPIVISVTGINPSCPGEGTGGIDISVNGASPFTFLWSNGANTEDLSGVPVGTYIVTVTDAFGCEASLTATINQAITPPEIIATTTSPTCFGATDGSITLSFDPTGDYIINWSNGASGNPLEGVGEGQYTATVTDVSTGCEIDQGQVADIALLAPTAISASINQVIDATCATASDGSIVIDVDGGTPPYTYTWTGGSSMDATISGLAVGAYTITITDANMCTATATAAIGEGNGITLSFVNENIFCASGSPDGTMDVIVDNGNGTYTYNWAKQDDPGFTANTASITDLDIGTYCVTVTDVTTGCIATACETLTGEGEWPYLESVTIQAAGVIIYEGAWTPTTNGCVTFSGGTTDQLTDGLVQSMEDGLIDLAITAQSNVDLLNLLLSFPDFSGVPPFFLSTNGLEWVFTVSPSGVAQLVDNSTIDLLLSFEGVSTNNLPLFDFIGAGGTNQCIFLPQLQDNCNWNPTPIINPSGSNGIDQVHRLKKGCLTPIFTLTPEEGQIEITSIEGGTPPYNIFWLNPSSGATILNDGMIIKGLEGGAEYLAMLMHQLLILN
jgi:hypothetical protein